MENRHNIPMPASGWGRTIPRDESTTYEGDYPPGRQTWTAYDGDNGSVFGKDIKVFRFGSISDENKADDGYLPPKNCLLDECSLFYVISMTRDRPSLRYLRWSQQFDVYGDIRSVRPRFGQPPVVSAHHWNEAKQENEFVGSYYLVYKYRWAMRGCHTGRLLKNEVTADAARALYSTDEVHAETHHSTDSTKLFWTFGTEVCDERHELKDRTVISIAVNQTEVSTNDDDSNWARLLGKTGWIKCSDRNVRAAMRNGLTGRKQDIKYKSAGNAAAKTRITTDKNNSTPSNSIEIVIPKQSIATVEVLPTINSIQVPDDHHSAATSVDEVPTVTSTVQIDTKPTLKLEVKTQQPAHRIGGDSDNSSRRLSPVPALSIRQSSPHRPIQPSADQVPLSDSSKFGLTLSSNLSSDLRSSQYPPSDQQVIVPSFEECNIITASPPESRKRSASSGGSPVQPKKRTALRLHNRKQELREFSKYLLAPVDNSIEPQRVCREEINELNAIHVAKRANMTDAVIQLNKCLARFSAIEAELDMSKQILRIRTSNQPLQMAIDTVRAQITLLEKAVEYQSLARQLKVVVDKRWNLHRALLGQDMSIGLEQSLELAICSQIYDLQHSLNGSGNGERPIPEDEETFDFE